MSRVLARRLRLEHVLFAAIVGGTLLLRAVCIADRPLHHDESIHAHAAWRILVEGVGRYHYDPVYHGPTLYYLTALLEAVFGPSDFSARLLAALCGTGLVLLAWPLRPLIGRRQAFAFAMLVALSPTLGYYGRSLRHDLPFAFFLLGAVVAVLRFLGGRDVRVLYLGGFLAGLAAATKEDVYLAALVFAAAIAVAVVTDTEAAPTPPRRRSNRRSPPRRRS